MNRSKSAGAVSQSGDIVSPEELRTVFRRVAPYIVRLWRDVCQELGVSPAVLDGLDLQHKTGRKSELAFQGLCRWMEVAGRGATKTRLLRVLTELGLARAEEELRSMDQQQRVPYMGRPATATGTADSTINRHTKQRALADRLSRPKSTASSDQKNKKITNKTSQAVTIPRSGNPLLLQPNIHPKPGEICEVKLKVTLRGIHKLDKDELELTKDNFKSTKDDYKHVCHTFVNLVMSKRKRHLLDLKTAIAFPGIFVQRLTKFGFNIQLFILCHSLGAFENLNRAYTTGRLKRIIERSLVTQENLDALKASHVELCVELDEGLVNKYREMLILREAPELTSPHPVDEADYFRCENDDDSDEGVDPDKDAVTTFSLQTVVSGLNRDIEGLNKRCETLNESMKDLIVTLRIARPSSTQEIACLQDLLDCHQTLRNSHTAGHSTRVELLREYIATVNQIRIKVQEIDEKDLFISFDDTVHPEDCDSFHRTLSKVQLMLEPKYRFEADDKDCVAKQTLTGMEQEMFEGLLGYLPRLMKCLHSLVESLTVKQYPKADRPQGGQTNQQTDRDHDENKENISEPLKEKREQKCQICSERANNSRKQNSLLEATSVRYIETWTPG